MASPRWKWDVEPGETVSRTVVILGCGSYGMPLANYARSLNMSAVYVGGATQLMFGVSGHRYVEKHLGRPRRARWDNDKEGLPNKYWKYPFAHEIPKGSMAVEDGAYWRRR